MFTTILAILMIGILVIAHEWGHFAASRACGIPVREFCAGFGPKLWQKQGKKGTLYTVRAIPFGGYCAYYAEDDRNGIGADDPRLFYRQKAWKRLIAALMGPVMNFLLAFVVAVFFLWIGGIGEATGYTPAITQVEGAGPAYFAGLKDGDVFVSVDGDSMENRLSDVLGEHLENYKEGGEPLVFTVRRNGELIEKEITPFWDEELGRYRIGVNLLYTACTVFKPVSFGEAFVQAGDSCMYAGTLILTTLRNMFTTGEGLDQTTGPIGTVDAVNDELKTGGARSFFNMLIVLSINLGIFNLLPIPGLDGSRVLFLLLEMIRRKPIAPEKEAMIHVAGYVLIFGLLIVLTWRDVLRLFN